MRILWVSDKDGCQGGGSTSERTLLRYMANTQHDLKRLVATSMIGSAIARGPHEIRQKILGSLLKSHLNSRFRKYDVPDVIVSHGIYYPQVGEMAVKYNIPHLVFIRDQNYYCHCAKHAPCDTSCWACIPTRQKVIYPLVKNIIRQKINGLSKCDMVLTNSYFMKKEIGEYTNKIVNVLFPPMDFHNGNVHNLGSHDKVLYLGCGSWKGTKMVMDIGKLLPNYEFLLAGDPEVPKKWNLGKYLNIDWVPWIDRTIAFDTARIILFPSQWPEPFGRVPVEGGNRGIPTIGSAMGGIPESVGPGGILISPGITELWKTWTSILMEDDDLRNSMGKMARKHSINFGIDRIGPQFEGFLRDTVSGPDHW